MLALAAGCQQGPGSAAGDSARVDLPAELITSSVNGILCQGTGAHDAHAAIMGCETCHPCAGVTGFDNPLTLPGGTTTAGGVIVRGTGGEPTTCAVGCHDVSGTSPPPIAWNADPLKCTACHASPQTSPASSHPADSSDVESNRASCRACHVLDEHLGGNVRVDVGDGTAVQVSRDEPELTNPACEACHDGDGRSLAGRTPPILPGWTSATGDFHGARAGTGFGGSLLAPFARGQGPVACISCHDPHDSTSAFLFAANVNGYPRANSIDRAGLGAEALCSSCHAGARHQRCIDCHRDLGVCVSGDGAFDPPSYRLCQDGVAKDPAPAGSACFFCHGHEGIVNFPGTTFPDRHPNSNSQPCTHCHAREGGVPWMPAAIDRTAPTLVQGYVGVSLAGNSATITWTTNEKATSYVEFGVGSRNRVAGHATPTTSHEVTLSGLLANTTYTFRVRSADAFRNVMLGPVQTLAAASADAPPAPALVALEDLWSNDDWKLPVTFRWNPASDPQGDPVQYRLVVDDDPNFGSVVDSGWITATSRTVTLTAEGYFYWRVMARDAAHGTTSPWSTVDQFYLQGWYE